MLTPQDVTETGAGGWGRSERNRRDSAVPPWKQSSKSLAELVAYLRCGLLLEVSPRSAACGYASCVSATRRFFCAAHRASKAAYSFSKETPCNPNLILSYASFHLLGKADSRLLANFSLFYAV